MRTIFVMIKSELGRAYDVADAAVQTVEEVSEVHSISGQEIERGSEALLTAIRRQSIGPQRIDGHEQNVGAGQIRCGLRATRVPQPRADRNHQHEAHRHRQAAHGGMFAQGVMP